MEADVIIVGAGIPGLCLAYYLNQKKINTIIIDLKKKNNLGENLSGEVIDDETVKLLKEKFNIRIPKKLVNNKIDEFFISSINIENKENVNTKAYILDKKGLSNYLVNKLDKKFVKFIDRTIMIDFIWNNNDIRGIVCKDMGTQKEMNVFGKIIVDATGSTAALRRKLPKNRFVIKELKEHDRAVAFKEELEVKEGFDKTILYFDPSKLGAGYFWIIPEKDSIITGIGIPGMPKYIKNIHNEYKKKLGIPLEADSLNYTSGIMPLRRPVNSLVFKNIMFVGNSGCQVNPLMPEYIGFQIRGVLFAGETIRDKINHSHIDTKTLWEYNKKYMENVGGQGAVLEGIRDFLTSLTTEDFEFILKNNIVPSELLQKLGSGIRTRDIIFNSKNIILNPGLILKFFKLTNYTKRVKSLYDNYPEYDMFNSWSKKLEELIKNIKKSFLV